MSLKAIAQWVLPPALYRFCRNKVLGPSWEGVFERFDQVRTCGGGFDNDGYVEEIRRQTSEALDQQKAGAMTLTGEDALLPLLAATVLRDVGRVRILDFGGGMGVGYIQVRSGMPESGLVEYYVVEGGQLCEGGRGLFSGDKSIRFLEDLPAFGDSFDIVYLNSVLQYIDDYQGLIRKLASYKPKYFLMVRLSAGDCVTHVTAQVNIPGVVFPYRFINANELVGVLAACGYSLIYRSALGEECDQSGFEKRFRIGRTCNFLFTRQEYGVKHG